MVVGLPRPGELAFSMFRFDVHRHPDSVSPAAL
jgi:hypothetical protein